MDIISQHIAGLIYTAVQGFIVGIIISAPVGPVGFMCISRTLNYGFLSGIFTAAGATIADTTYAILATFGISIIATLLSNNPILAAAIRILGAIILLFMAYKVFKKKVVMKSLKGVKRKSKIALLSDCLSTMVLTLLNPLTVFAFLAIFAGMSSAFQTPLSTIILLFSVVIGALSWWVSLVLVITAIRHTIKEATLKKINRISSSIMFLLAGFIIVSSLYELLFKR